MKHFDFWMENYAGKKKKEKKEIKPPAYDRERASQETSVCMQMCCGWTRRSLWLLLHGVSASTVLVPASPCPGSKLSFEVLSTNWEEMETLSSKKCWVALNFRYETPPFCRRGAEWLALWSTVMQDPWCKWKGRDRKAPGALWWQSHHLLNQCVPRGRATTSWEPPWRHTGISTSPLFIYASCLWFQSLLPGAVVLSFPSFQDGED